MQDKVVQRWNQFDFVSCWHWLSADEANHLRKSEKLFLAWCEYPLNNNFWRITAITEDPTTIRIQQFKHRVLGLLSNFLVIFRLVSYILENVFWTYTCIWSGELWFQHSCNIWFIWASLHSDTQYRDCNINMWIINEFWVMRCNLYSISYTV